MRSTRNANRRHPPRPARGYGLVALALGLLLLGKVAGPAVGAGPDAEGTLIARVRSNPLEIVLTVPSSTVPVGGRFEIEVVVRNHGDIRLREVDMKLHMVEECLDVSGPFAHHRGLLQENRSVSTRWLLRAIDSGEGCQSIIVMASATAVDEIDSELISGESQAKVVTIAQP